MAPPFIGLSLRTFPCLTDPQVGAQTPAMITGHRGNGAPEPDLFGPASQRIAARSGAAAFTLEMQSCGFPNAQ
jgi:hypothetical protein